ncbi:MAG: T9SS type A sorting domain-containing protein [Bacteroidota bacterium]|jgi:hypothetical protein
MRPYFRFSYSIINRVLLFIVLIIIDSKQIRAQMITTLAGNGNYAVTVPGPVGPSTSFYWMDAIRLDASGNIFVASSENKIFKITPSGVLSVFAGNGSFVVSGDGGQAINAGIGRVRSMVFDAAGNLYFCSPQTHRIRKISTTGVITTVAGTGTQGFSGDGGLATSANIAFPWGIAIDASDNFYFTDGSLNNSQNGSRIRKVDAATGIISTIAGTGTTGNSGNGGLAVTAQVYSLSNTVDKANNFLYIQDLTTDGIRKINLNSGIISAYAGNGTSGYSGDGGTALAAAFTSIFDMDVDGLGNLYLTQWSSTSVVRKITFAGIVSTIAGNGIPGFSGDGGNPLFAQLNMPHAVCTNPNGTEIFITDEQNKRIRKVDMVAAPICPNTFSVNETRGPNGQLILSHSISPQLGTPTYLGTVSGNPNLNPLPATNINTSGTYSITLPGNGIYSYNSFYHDTISGFACTRNFSDTVLINNSSAPRKFNRKFNVSSTFFCNSGNPNFTDSTTFYYSLNNPTATYTITTNWGNGSIVTNTVSATNQIIFSSAPTSYINPGAYLVQSIISGPGIANDTALVTINVSLCGNVTGTLYNDINNNCTQDFWNSEFPINQNIPMKLSNGTNTYFTWSVGGSYNFVNIPVGTYTIEALYGTTGYTITCPGSLAHSTNVLATGNTTENFAMNCTPGFDISASWISLWNGFFPGQSTAILPQVGILNGTCNFTIPGTVKMVLTPCINYLPSGSPANAPAYIIPASTGDTLVWIVPDINNLGNFNYWNYGIFASTCTTAVVGDTACITVMVTPTNGDVNPNNNIVTRCFEIGVSYDPNYKEVEPKGQGPQGNILPNTPELTYTIHFQNTGTAPALHVYLLDTIDVNLDLYTIEILGTSHYMQPYLLPGNTIKFMYSYINLPDSTHDEPNSHGYVTYRLKLKPGLPLGTQIKNTAYIYFDYNAPIVTNTTLNTLALTTNLNSQNKNSGIVIYPNPGDSKINVVLNEINPEEIIITDVLGKEIRRIKITGSAIEIETSDLREGVYFIKILKGDASLNQKFIISR